MEEQEGISCEGSVGGSRHESVREAKNIQIDSSDESLFFSSAPWSRVAASEC